VTVAANVAPVNGQVPDAVGVYVKSGGNTMFGLLSQVSPGATSWTGTVAIADGSFVFPTNPLNFSVTFATQWQGGPFLEFTGDPHPNVGVVQACS
jgi:hypothetical protein